MYMMSIRGDSSNVLNTHKVYVYDEYQGRILEPMTGDQSQAAVCQLGRYIITPEKKFNS